MKRSIEQHRNSLGDKDEKFLDHLQDRLVSGDSVRFPFVILATIENNRLMAFQMNDYLPPVGNAVVFHGTDFPKKKKIICDGKNITEYESKNYGDDVEDPLIKTCEYKPGELSDCHDFFLQVFLEAQCMLSSAIDDTKPRNDKLSINRNGDKLHVVAVSSNGRLTRSADYIKNENGIYILEHFTRTCGIDSKNIENEVGFSLKNVKITTGDQ